MAHGTEPPGITDMAESDGSGGDIEDGSRHREVEQTIDELLDDESWLRKPGALDVSRDHFEEHVALAGDEPVEELLPPEALFPAGDDDQDDDDAVRPVTDVRARRFG